MDFATPTFVDPYLAPAGMPIPGAPYDGDPRDLFFTVGQLAKRCGTSTRTIRRDIAHGLLKPTRTAGIRGVRVRGDIVQKYLRLKYPHLPLC